MSGHGFDALARGIAAGATRRTLLAAAVGAAVAVTQAAGGAAKADQCRPIGKRCHLRQPCCSDAHCVDGVCQPLDYCGSILCPAGTWCCNPSCEICAPIGDGCIQDLC